MKAEKTEAEVPQEAEKTKGSETTKAEGPQLETYITVEAVRRDWETFSNFQPPRLLEGILPRQGRQRFLCRTCRGAFIGKYICIYMYRYIYMCTWMYMYCAGLRVLFFCGAFSP